MRELVSRILPQPRIHELFSETAAKSEIAFGFNKIISMFLTSKLPGLNNKTAETLNQAPSSER